ncbi:MAG TPA: hypothetical protein DCS20_03615 [Candidatus Yonathbacteria bacterium]|nr:hypothetical protein [Candidatus Yonathbacteria bacterium]
MKHLLPIQSSKRGVTLLISVLLSAVVLAVGMGVYQRTYKELLFSSFWKQAQIAFAAADSALECVLYFQLHPAEPPTCFGAAVAGWANPNIPASFPISTGGVCADVVITSNGLSTTTKVYGYNTCVVTNPRRVQRGLEITY